MIANPGDAANTAAAPATANGAGDQAPPGTGTNGGAGARGIHAFLGGEHASGVVHSASRRQKAAPPESKIIQHNGQPLTVFTGTHAVEVREWVYIVAVKDNGTKTYQCARCSWQRTCKIGDVINHLMRISGTGVKICSRTPTSDMADVLERFIRTTPAASGALAKASKTAAVGMTPSVLTQGFSAQETARARVDSAIATLVSVHDMSWNAFDSRNPLWCEVVRAIQAAPSYTPPPRDVLSNHAAPVGGARSGGLYLAHEGILIDRRNIIKSVSGQSGVLGSGGTLASDGVKVSTRRASMLNTSLVTPKGVLPVQSTDATGKKKDGNFLSKDLAAGIEKLGFVTDISRSKSDGSVVIKKSSSVVKVVILDRGGGCESALRLLEEKFRVLGDTCKGHGADLLIEDLARPFKLHIKQCHQLIIFIISHDAVYGIFSKYEGVRSLNLPAETRFATEVICLRSLLGDKSQIKQLFVDKQFEDWCKAQKDAKIRTKVCGATAS